MIKANSRMAFIRLLGSTSLVLLAGAAVAEEVDNAPASMCVAASGAVVNVLATGEVENANGNSVTLICPTERKTVGGVYTTKLKGKVFTRDRHTSQEICCLAGAKAPDGTATLGNRVCTTSTSPSYSILDVPELTVSSTFAHFFFQCTLPGTNPGDGGRSQVVSFRSIQN